MKLIFTLLLCIPLLFACKKNEVAPSAPSYYWSSGNFLILVIGDSLEAAYEYNLTSTQLVNDSLPIEIESAALPTSTYNFDYWKFAPNSDTLFWTNHQIFEWKEARIDAKELWIANTPMLLDTSQFQSVIWPINPDLEILWSEVENLEIVQSYRATNPTSKIGVSRHIIYTYLEEFEFSIPVEKHFLYFAK
ncbi:MAG: hypothetical protein ACI865_003005 [Flavobacteriaceae bacterium]|jgi:hypothetical protein